MSAPATKAFSPAPVSTTARTPASSLNAVMARASSVSVWLFKALRTFGRLRVTMATASSRSIRRLSKVMRLPSHDTPRPRGTEAHGSAGGVVPDVAPFRKSRRDVHLDPFHAQAVQHRDCKRRDHRTARDAAPSALRRCAKREHRQYRVTAGVKYGVREPVANRRGH